MEHDRRLRRGRWGLRRTLGAVVLTAGVLAVGLPAGTAVASQAATKPPSFSLDIFTSVKALGHTWSLSLLEDSGVVVGLGTTNTGVTEGHEWTTSPSFVSTAAKELKVTSTGHATFKTGTALSPVLGVSVSFTPTKATKRSCSKGSDTTYSGKVSGTLSLATGLHGGVKIHVTFSKNPGATLDVDRSCVIKGGTGKNICLGGSWFVSGTNVLGGDVLGVQTLGAAKSTWLDGFSQAGLKTASKRLTRSVSVDVNGPAPKLNTAAKTVSVSGRSSGGITGAAVISYSDSFTQPATTCFVGSKKFKETMTSYFGSKVKVSKPFQAHSLLAGTLTMKSITSGSYTAAKLSAA